MQNNYDKYRPTKKKYYRKSQTLTAIITEVIAAIAIIFLLIGLFVNITPAIIKKPNLDATPDKITTFASSAIVVDFQTGQVLSKHNVKEKFENASTSKLLTAYLVQKAVKDGKLSWSQTITPTVREVELSNNSNLANVSLSTDKKYTVRYLYTAMINLSANAAAITLGDAISGDIESFAKLMNKTAVKLKIPKSEISFYNAAGLKNADLGNLKVSSFKDDDENKMSAKAIATVIYKLFKDYPSTAQTMLEKEFTTLNNNTLIPYTARINDVLGSQSNIQAIAAKTGTTEKGGSVIGGLFKNMTTKRQFIAVVMHGSEANNPNYTWLLARRYIGTADTSGSTYEFEKGKKVVGAAEVDMQNTIDAQVPLVAKYDTNIWVNASSDQKPVVSVNPVPFNLRLNEVTTKTTFIADVNNVKHNESLYGVSKKLGVALVPKKASGEDWNPFVKFWRLLIH